VQADKVATDKPTLSAHKEVTHETDNTNQHAGRCDRSVR
jgi:hypothetical protein